MVLKQCGQDAMIFFTPASLPYPAFMDQLVVRWAGSG
jgi:hypothetical protein